MVSQSVFTSIEVIIFGSYVVISCVVLYIYYRHKDYLDSLVNRLLALTFGFFLMLCAFTHLHSVWYEDVSIPLSVACAVVSFVAAACTLHSFRGLDDYLALRISTASILRERTIQTLTQGYDFRCCVVNGEIVDGCIKGYEGGFPVALKGGIQIGNIIDIQDKFFRVVSSVETSVDLKSTTRLSSDEEEVPPNRLGSMIYGYDATAEVHMSKEEERMNEMKMEMCMGTAHDVRTPLTSLGIVVSSLRDRRNMNDDEFDKLLDEAFVNLEILNLVATQFMEIGTVGTGVKIRSTIGSFEVLTMVKRIEKVCERLTSENVQTRVEVGEAVPSSLLTDVEWVWQILMNLVTNAAKYTHKGLVEVFIGYRDEKLELRVQDTGIGIDDKQKEAVFDKFFTQQKYSHSSAGIGLYSVKTKVDILGGSCTVSDNPGGGSIFVVKIPVRVDAVVLGDDVDEYSPMEEPDCNQRSCLVVDDTTSIRKMMRHVLRPHRVDSASNGAEGLEKLKSNEYDIALLDMCMPVMDGAECVRRFREWEKAHRGGRRQIIYSMSANVIEVDDEFDGSLPKPMDSKRLRAVLHRSPRVSSKQQAPHRGSTKVIPMEQDPR